MPTIAPGPFPALTLALTALLTGARAQCSLQWQPTGGTSGPSGHVDCLAALPNGDVVAGGWFTAAGTAFANRVARWDGAAWQPLGAGTDDVVFCAATMANGDLVVGGIFQNAGGAPASRIARWNGVAWSALGAGIDGPVNALLVLPNGDLIAGGVFAHAGGIAADRVARWDGSTWSPLGQGIGNGQVLAFARLANGDLLAAGSFTQINGSVPSVHVARFDGASWQPVVGLMGSTVHALARLPNGDVAIGGAVRLIGAVELFGVVTWNGTTFQPISPGSLSGSPWGTVSALAVEPSGTLLAGGTGLGGGLVARWNGSTWTSFAPRPQAITGLLPRSNGDVVACGGPPQVLMSSPEAVVRWNGATWTVVGAPPQPYVTRFAAQRDGSLLAIGRFASIEGVAANNVARRAGGSWSPLGLGVAGDVGFVATAPNGDVIVAGNFTTAGGAPANHIARWNGFTWSTLGAGLGDAPAALAVAGNGDVLVYGGGGGEFGWRWNGVFWSPLPVTAMFYCTALATLANGDVVASGGFDDPAFSAPATVVRWTGAGWTPFAPGLNSEIERLAVTSTGDLIASGPLLVGGVPAHVARWNGSAWSALGAAFTSAIPNTASILSLEVLPNDDVLVGGRFAANGGVQLDNLARWDGGAWRAVDHGVGPAVSGVAAVGATADGEVFASGSFVFANGVLSGGLVHAVSPCPASVAAYGAGCTGSAGQVTLHAEGLPWLGGTFRATATGMAPLSLAVHALGTQAALVPLPVPGCFVFVDPIVLDVLTPAAGLALATFAIPRVPSLAGQIVRSQVVGLEFGAGFVLTGITGSNGLQLTLGSFD